MLRSVCLSIVKVAAVVVCLGVGTSACWVHGRDGGYGDHRDYHEGRGDEHRGERR
jgi:hypothetical protein